ncbi:MAG: peptidase [Paucimonas sp.]|nr:peptidase [Paucimonas sp.]
MSVLHTVFAFLVAIGILVVVHELGHYWAAKICGVKVLRFSVGMGPVVFSRKFSADQTEWAVSAFPIGGYVKMLDAREAGISPIPKADLHREFTRQNVWKRIFIVAAGPAANFILAILLFAALFVHGMPDAVPTLQAPASNTPAYAAGLRGGETVKTVDGSPVRGWSELHWQIVHAVLEKNTVTLEAVSPASEHGTTLTDTFKLRADEIDVGESDTDLLVELGLDLWRPPADVEQVIPQGAAEKAGLMAGDRILKIDGAPIKDGRSLVERISLLPGRQVEMEVLRGGAPLILQVMPQTVEEKGRMIGRIGVTLKTPQMTMISETPLRALDKACRKTWDGSILTLKMLGKIVTGQASWENISGPLTIADYAGQTAKVGMISYIGFIAFVSISLGIMNLLPIPVLDGGLLLYYSLEVFSGRPLSERATEIAQRAGIGILMALMAVAVFNDIAKLLS